MLYTLDEAFAKSPSNVYGDWKLLTFKEDKKKICYLLNANGKDGAGKKVKSHIIVTNIDKNNDEFSYTGNQPLKQEEISVIFKANKFGLFAKGKTAWLKNQEDEAKITKLMQKEKDIQVNISVQKAKTKRTEVFSLTGFSSGHKAMKAECK